MQVFQINDEILVSHGRETAKIDWSHASIPDSWQAKVTKGEQTIVNTIAWSQPLTSQSQTSGTKPDGRRLFVHAMMSGDTPAIVVALDFAPDDYVFQVEYRGVGHEH